jgi:hypothetical protein
MVGAAEELVYPGKRPRPQVAILSPRKEMPVAQGVSDATNTNLNGATLDYMAEVFDLYLALQHANVPVDFVEEEDLSAKGLESYKVLYVTEPNVPEENQRGLVEWVSGGGTLVTVSGAAARDRYDEPCNVLAEFTGLREQPRDRLPVPDLAALQEAAKGKGEFGEFVAVGVRGTFAGPPPADSQVSATFADGSPAVVSRAAGKGRVIHFAWLPGLSYAKSSAGTKDHLPVGFSESIRRLITSPVERSGATGPVRASVEMVETPVLLSDKGAAVTLLNWTGDPVAKLDLDVQSPFDVRSIESVKHGALPVNKVPGGVRISLPLGAADIVLIRP